MAIPYGIMGPILGAVISGCIGIFTVEFRQRRNEIAEIENWYDNMIRLAEQVEREAPDSYIDEVRGQGSAAESISRKEDMLDAYERISERLRDNVNHAPHPVDDSVIDIASDTARQCNMVVRRDFNRRTGNSLFEPLEKAITSAEALRETAENSKDKIGYLSYRK